MFNCLVDEKTGTVLLCTRGRVWPTSGQVAVQHPTEIVPRDHIYDFKLQKILEKSEEQLALQNKPIPEEVEGEKKKKGK